MNKYDYCEIHKDKVAIFRCSKCSRSVCSRCSLSASSFCPKCRGTDILKVEKKHSQNEIRNILITGFVISLISVLINTLTDNSETISNKTLIINSIIFFGLGISIASAIYFVRKTDVFDDIQDLPIIGFRLIKYLVIGSSILGIPIFYFLYLVYEFLKKKDEILRSKNLIQSIRNNKDDKQRQ